MDKQDNSPIIIDTYEPNYRGECESCGQSPTVTAVKNGKTIHDFGLCGPCTWGEAAMIDPSAWNE